MEASTSKYCPHDNVARPLRPSTSYRSTWNVAQSKQPIWSAFVASLLLGNSKSLLNEIGFGSLFNYRQTVSRIYLNSYLRCLRTLDRIFRKKEYSSEIVRLHASGCQIVDYPDSFLEDFEAKVPVEILDKVFEYLPSTDIRNVQLVSKKWHSLVKSRRNHYSKKEIGCLTISYNRDIARVSSGGSSTEMFDGASSVKIPISDIQVQNLRIYFYNGFNQDES
ncbi:unnamed protein product [Caenorhabditis bovis]|uniref:F-box domain-containing protein n=1 Tax=Caenorhabditis bovis TaxID=2654633 RepID=A0A8S1FB22_9PELO|nr:unnamed protein product [Caenorhabditis bovis]